MEVLLFKYLKAGIGYDGIYRVESYPMPEPALREALLNAVVHRDYAVPAPIRIRVHDDRLRIYNPLRACRRAGTPAPEIRLEPGGLWFEFGFSDDYLESVGVTRKRGEGSGATSEGPGRDSP